MGWFDWLVGTPAAEAARAQALMDQGQYGEAERALLWAASGEHLAMLAECQFQQGRAAEAVATARRGLWLGDDGPRTPLWGAVYEGCRYLGDGAGAAEACYHLAGQDRRYLTQAALVRRGEPLLRVVADVGGQRYEIDEVVEGVQGAVRLMFERNRLSLRAVSEGVKRLEAMLSSRDYQHETFMAEALALAKLCPHDPAPRYHIGHGLALKGRWDEAEHALREVEALAPGWFLVRSELDLLRWRDVVLFRNWLAASDSPLPEQTKREIVAVSLARWPDCAHMHHLHGRQLRERQRRPAERAYRRAMELATTPDLLTRVCVGLAAVTPDDEERLQLLRRAVELGADIPAAANARIVLALEGGPPA